MLSDNNFRSASSLTQGKSVAIPQNIYNEDSLAQVGECQMHKRVFEAFCTNCHVLICPTCLMFGEHKGHTVSAMEEASKTLRTQMDDAARTGKLFPKNSHHLGILKLEKTENVLVDIRHTKLSCEEAKQRVLKEVEATFQAVFKLIKQRKEEVINEVNNHFINELQKITNQEGSWIDRQERGLELIKLARSPNDAAVLQRAPYILQSLELLKSSPTYQNVHLVNSLDTNYCFGNLSLNFNEFRKGLEKWVKLGDPVLIQFKC